MENKDFFIPFNRSPIAIVGDLYVDEFIYGEAHTIAEDGLVPIVHSVSRSWQPAAAGYTALLLAGLGGRIHLLGRTGPDVPGQVVRNHLTEHGIDCTGLVVDPSFSTPTRLRINAGGPRHADREMVRVLSEHRQQAGAATAALLKKRLRRILPRCRAVVLMDKDTGLIDQELVAFIRTIAPEAILIGDSEKNPVLLSRFDVVIANESETAAALAEPAYTADSGDRLRRRLKTGLLFISHGADGISVHQAKEPARLVSTERRQVYDRVGAGEAVVAAITAALVAGQSPDQTAEFANLTAGVAIAKPGLAEITREELLRLQEQRNARLEAHKIVSMSELRAVVADIKQSGRRIVWTNGCFDIMHVGHILYLEKARSLGDLLVVGLNSDASVRSFKGPDRPIVEEKQRAKLLSALSCVDYVIIFEDTSPIELIADLQPDIYAKGGDYHMGSINQEERRLVETYGGRIVLLPGVPGMSTSHLIEKIVKTYR